MKAVILCAGEGERMKPLTIDTPKPLLIFKGKPILFHILNSLPKEITEIIFVIQSRHKSLFEYFLRNNFPDLNYTFKFQDLNQKGTYFALLECKDLLVNENNFLVLNGDDIFIKSDLEKLISFRSPCYALFYKESNPIYRTCDLDINSNKIISFRLPYKDELNKQVPHFTGALILNNNFFDYNPVFFGTKNEAGIPHTLFKSFNNVSFILFKNWIQINHIEDLE